MSSPDFVFFPIHTKISITLHKLIALQILRHMYLSLELLPRLSRIELPAPCQIFILGMIQQQMLHAQLLSQQRCILRSRMVLLIRMEDIRLFIQTKCFM